MRTLLSGVLLMLACEAALAQQKCPTKPNDLVKPPVLSGLVQDAALNVHFEWISTARPIDGAWRITHSVCNLGASSLILTWPKTGINATALTSIPPGNPILVSHTVGSEPDVDGSPIKYGFAYTTEASSYQKAPTDQKTKKLSSSAYGVVEKRWINLPTGEEYSYTWDVQMFFEVDRRPDGYSLKVGIKNSDTGRLSMAVSSSQNTKLVAAFKSKGIDVTERVLAVRPGSNPLLALRSTLVVVSVLDVARFNEGVIIPVSGDDIEVAEVALLDETNVPIMFANLSLFK